MSTTLTTGCTGENGISKNEDLVHGKVLFSNMEAMTAKYVDVRLERKRAVLDAYHNALHPKPKEDNQKKEPKKTSPKKQSEKDR